MPRRNSSVKSNSIGRSLGAIDLHFHGAFGVDLMTADAPELNDLCERLWQNGIAGFCPTTLSSAPDDLRDAVERLGSWTTSYSGKGAVPIGIHLEGPFINTSCCGAHPESLIRRLDWQELERLWKASRETLKILTLAPETLSQEELGKLGAWAKARRVALSLGHSKATQAQAEQAFEAGFRGITHAWNALSFHHRSPGALGAALGNRAAYVELIIDQVHVAPTLIEWTQKLHPASRLCFISDCVPAAATTNGSSYSFGPLQVHYVEGACRISVGAAKGALAGGGKLLTRSFGEWLERQVGADGSKSAIKLELRRLLPSITVAPLWALQIPATRFGGHKVEWRMDESGKVRVAPIDSPIDSQRRSR